MSLTSPSVITNHCVLFYAAYQAEVTELVTSNAPVELVHEMWQFLLSYAQAFERDAALKPFMDMSPHEWHAASDHGYAFRTRWSVETRVKNPFRTERYVHPVEAALSKAKKATNFHDIVGFKMHRNAVLEYLERQYQEIETAAAAMANFIKDEKISDRLFDMKGWIKPHYQNHLAEEDIDALGLALVLLDQYAHSFQRHMLLQMKAYIRVYQPEFYSHYHFFPHEILITKTSWAADCSNCKSFVENFKAAVDNLDTQYLEIREARKARFRGDRFDRCCEIDTATPLYEEMIDWSVYEPRIAPASDLNEPEYNPRDFLRVSRQNPLGYALKGDL